MPTTPTCPIASLAPEHRDACESIARNLPAWFGIEEGLQDLRHCLETQRGLAAHVDGMVAGFVTLEWPFPETCEITWMAVDRTHHRHGIGAALIAATAALARELGSTLLHVKTLADTHPSPEYARTRAFYAAMGFQRVTVVPELWDPANPCLLLVRPVG